MAELTAKALKYIFLPDRVQDDYIAEFFDFRTISSTIKATVVHWPLYILNPDHQIRIYAMNIINNNKFGAFILLTILVNSVVLALDNPSDPSDTSLAKALSAMDNVFLSIFLLEMVLKIVALGFVLHQNSYLRDAWNVLDFLVVMAGVIQAAAGGAGLTALRVLRVFRPLRSVARVDALREILNKLVASLPRLSDVFALMMFVTWFAAVLGINLFAGIHDYRCFYDAHDYDASINKSTWRLVMNTSDFVCADSTDSCVDHVGISTRVACINDPNAVESSVLSFTNIGTALILSLKLISRDNWGTQISQVASGTGIGSFFYFFLVTFFGGYFCLNLFIAVLTSAFQFSDDVESARKEFPYRMRFAHSLGGSILSDGALCACHESRTILHRQDDDESTDGGYSTSTRGGGDGGGSDIDSDDNNGGDLIQQQQQHQQRRRISATGSQISIGAASSSTRSHHHPHHHKKAAAEETLWEELQHMDENVYPGSPKTIHGKKQGHHRHRSTATNQTNKSSSNNTNKSTNNSDNDDDDDDDTDEEIEGMDEVAAARHKLARRRQNLANNNNSTTGGGGDGENTAAKSKNAASSSAAKRDPLAILASNTTNTSNVLTSPAKPKTTTALTISATSATGAAPKTSLVISSTGAVLPDPNNAPKQKSWFRLSRIQKWFRQTGWEPLHVLVISVPYTLFVMLVVLVFAVALSLDGVGISQATTDTINNVSLACNIFFLVDVVLKIIGLGPSFVHSGANWMDLILAAASIPDLVNQSSNALSALRAFRLLRLLRIAKQWSSLQRLLNLVVVSIKSVASLSLVALIFIYIFAILGFQLFNQDVPNSRFSFATVFDSLLTVFVLVTGENWSDMTRDMMPVTGVGCVFYFIPIFIIGNFFIANLFIAIIIDSFGEVSQDDEEDEDDEDNDRDSQQSDDNVVGGQKRVRFRRRTSNSSSGGSSGGGGSYYSGSDNGSSYGGGSNYDDEEMRGVVGEHSSVSPDLHARHMNASRDLLTTLAATRQVLVPCDDSSDEDEEMIIQQQQQSAMMSLKRRQQKQQQRLLSQQSQSQSQSQQGGAKYAEDTFDDFGVGGDKENMPLLTSTTTAAAAAGSGRPRSASSRQHQRQLQLYYREEKAARTLAQRLGVNANFDFENAPSTSCVDSKRNSPDRTASSENITLITVENKRSSSSPPVFSSNIERRRREVACGHLLTDFAHDRTLSSQNIALVRDSNILTRAAAREMEHVERIRHEEQRLSQHAVAFVTLSRIKKQGQGNVPQGFGKLRDDSKQEEFKTVAEQRSFEDRFEGAMYRSLCLFEPDNKYRIMLVDLLKSNVFNFVILFLIVTSSILLAFDTPQITDGVPGFGIALLVTDYIIAVAFGIEMFIRIVALGGCMHPGSYFRSFWNIIDFSVTFLSIIALGVADLKPIRIIRIVRLTAQTFHMRIVITSLLQALPGMSSVVVFMLFVWWIFAIVGVASFKGTFNACNDIELDSVDCNGTYTINITNHDGSISYQNMPREWELLLPSSHFDDIPSALYTLLKLSLGDGWFEIMYTALDSPGAGLAPVRNSNIFAALYFVVFMIVGNFFILNLFVGVLADRFVSLRQRGSGYHLLSESQKQWVLAQRVLFRTEVPVTPPCPTNPIRRWCFYEVQTTRFDYFFTTIIVLQSIQLSMYTSTSAGESYGTALDAVGIVMLCLFTVEIAMKMLAFNPILFWRTTWNQVDFIIVAFSWLGVFVGNVISLVKVFRVFRLFLLLRKLKGIQTLFIALYQAIPELVNVGVVLGVVYSIFAVMGVALFSNIPATGDLSPLVNFQNVGSALIALYVCMTTDGWDVIADAVGVQDDCKPGECGNRMVAYTYFILYMFVMSMILVNLLVTVVLGNFKDAEIAEEQETLFQVIQEFRDRWAENDPDGSQRLDVAVVLRLLPTLPPSIWDHNPLKVRGRSLPMWIHFLRQLQRFHIPIGKDHTCTYRDVIASLALRLFCVNVEDAIRSSRTTSEGVTWDEKLWSIHHHYAALKLTRVARKFIRARGERMALRQLREIKEQHTILIEAEYAPLRKSHDEAVALARFAMKRAADAESQTADLRKKLEEFTRDAEKKKNQISNSSGNTSTSNRENEPRDSRTTSSSVTAAQASSFSSRNNSNRNVDDGRGRTTSSSSNVTGWR